ncbi:hypothetical protein BC940DRAFT_50361 [Gongronella butleri]|nr:hypothetical protein BC940DRAFT_50361 [Gongronella butleri]
MVKKRPFHSPPYFLHLLVLFHVVFFSSFFFFISFFILFYSPLFITMGANSSKESSSRSASLQSIHLKKTQEQVDFGSVFPNGLYSTAPQDFDARVLRQLILARKLAPFYKGLADAPEVVAAIPSPTHLATSTASATCSATAITAPAADHQLHRLQASASLTTLPLNSSSPLGRPRSASNRSDKMSRSKEKELAAERVKQLEATLYNDAVECPICFLYYPPNINYSRCCDQPICTECFIQIHRPTDDPSHAATCPYCLQDNYGAIYYPPAWSEKPSTTKNRLRSLSSSSSLSTNSSMSNLPSPTTPTSSGVRHTTSGSGQTNTPRRKSISHTHPDVVLIGKMEKKREREREEKKTTKKTKTKTKRNQAIKKMT